MDGYEATRIVLSRIQNLEPENASKIMGAVLIQDHGDKEMIRLALGPEALLQSVILKAKKELGLPYSPPTPSTPSSSSSQLSRQTSTASASRLHHLNLNHDELISPGSSVPLNPSSLPFYGSKSNGGADNNSSMMMDEFQLQDQLSFLNETTPRSSSSSHDLFYTHHQAGGAAAANDPMGFPSSYWGGSSFHRRSSSVSDILGEADDPTASGLGGWRPCLYFARGYCKNGNTCRFIHGHGGESAAAAAAAASMDSPNKVDMMMEQCHELLLLRSKSAQQHRFAAASHQLMASSASFPYSPKSMNLFLQPPQPTDTQRTAAALMMGDDMNKFSRSRLERNGFLINGEAGMVNPASRQIYLTFPADSTFREEDVSNYFSIYGPVQDVRIPYQQKRMFGFVTFVYAETVKIILAKGNPHFVCDARVLVKPYKEKGKVPDKKQQQQVERGGDFSPCGTPTGLDSISRDPFDLQLGGRSFYNNTQDMLWRRKLEEQADLQQTLELQNRRLMGLQLLDVKKHHHQRALSSGSPIPSPTHSPNLFSYSPTPTPTPLLPQFHTTHHEAPQENCSSPAPPVSAAAPEKQAPCTANIAAEEKGSGKESPHLDDAHLPESLEHNLPDSPFASPTKASGEYLSTFANAEADKEASVSANNNWVSSTLLPANNALDIASFNSFNCQLPRFSSGHGTIGMYAGTGGPTCPVGI